MAANCATLETIWEVDDELWFLIEPILQEFWPRKRRGRPVGNWRQCLNGIIYQMRSGCQWNHLPKQFGDDSTVHRWFQRWVEGGVFLQIWALLVEHCDELRGVEWKWQAADGALGKARFGGLMSAPIPRIERKTVRKRTCSSRGKAAHWPSKRRRPTGMTVCA
jgi:putative transposase